MAGKKGKDKDGVRCPKGHGQGSIVNRALALIWLTVRSILFDRKTIAVVAILFLLLAIPIYWFQNPASDNEGAAIELFAILVVIIYLQFIVLYVCLLYGTALITSEVEDRTFTYLLSRPINRFEVVLYKYVAYVVCISIMFSIPVTINYLILGSHSTSPGLTENWDLLGFTLAGITMGVMAWGALFMFLASVFKNPIMPGFLYCIFWESLIANMGGNISKVTLTYYIRTMIFKGADIFKQVSSDEEGGGMPPHGEDLATWEAFAVAMGVSIVFLLFSWLVIRNKDFH